MTNHSRIDRRLFLQAGVASLGGLTIAGSGTRSKAADKQTGPPAPGKMYPLKKAVKFGMIKSDGSIEEKFALIKRLGFQGLEMDSPSKVDREEALKARDKTGVEIHGVVDSIHWNQRLSDPKAEVRAAGLEGLKTAIADCKFYGGTTVLLVPGRVSNPETENYEQVYSRSQAEIRKVLPLADDAGVKIAIEVVWNDFITKPEQLVQYIDDFETPTVGAYFDCSNMLKYKVPAADWIRQLGKRMLKFDFKGYSHEKKWVAIGDGDENWPEVLKALDEIGYRNNWATAEVAGGGEKELQDISQRMDRIFTLPG